MNRLPCRAAVLLDASVSVMLPHLPILQITALTALAWALWVHSCWPASGSLLHRPQSVPPAHCCPFLPRRGSLPGQLSDLRAASVNNTRLATVAVLHKLHTFVRHHSPLLFADISTFVAEVQAAVAVEMAEDRADTPGQHTGQPGSPAPPPAQKQAADCSSQQNSGLPSGSQQSGSPDQDTHMPPADAFHKTTVSAMALALSDSESLPGHQAITSLPLDVPMAAAGQRRTQAAGEPAVEHITLQGLF